MSEKNSKISGGGIFCNWIYAIVAILVAGVALSWFMFVCKPNPWKKAEITAEKALKYSYANEAESIKVLGLWKTDSIVDSNFFSEADSEQLMAIMGYLSDKTLAGFSMASDDNANDEEMIHLSELSSEASRGMDAMMKQLSRQQSPAGRFSGWKVKIAYEVVSTDGRTEALQRWFVIDPDGNSVLESYTFPYLSELQNIK